MPSHRCQIASLPDLASIVVRGSDARSFLAAQLSQSPPDTESPTATLAAWHDAKGRVQALFRVLGGNDGYLLLTHASVAADVANALRRYVLRADVRIEAGEASGAAWLGACDAPLRSLGLGMAGEIGATARAGGVHALRVGATVVYALGSPASLDALAAGLERASAAAAELAEIRLGLPVVSAALRGLFLPQMLNLDELGGIAFDKGCYPGQEIIARTQNLGTIKRRLHRFVLAPSAKLPTPGARVLDAAGREVGIVVRAAAADGAAELLAVVELGALGGELRGDWDTAALGPAA